MTTRLRIWLPIVLALAVTLASFVLANWPDDGASDAPSTSTPNATVTRQAPPTSTGTAATQTARRDLGRDEAAGGHTLERHVGRTDQQLLQRLRDEPDISAASTYPDRETAERVVGAALQRSQSRIADWVRQGSSRPNLALDFEAGEVIGRSITQGRTAAHQVTSARVVLRANGQSWYVLTSYPDD